MASDHSPLKKLLGLFGGWVGKAEPAEAPAPRPRGAAPLSPGKGDAFVRAEASRAAPTGRLSGGSGPLAPPAPALSPEAAAAESKQRMAVIVAYMKDPTSDPRFRDKALIYSILSAERAYQQQVLQDAGARLGRLEADDPERAELQERQQTAQNRQTQLFLLMKRLTGVKGKTGGTGFLAGGQAPPPGEGTPTQPDTEQTPSS